MAQSQYWPTSHPDMKGKSEDEALNKSLLDKDWGAKIPDYITKGTFSLAVFLMSLTMRGVCLCVGGGGGGGLCVVVGGGDVGGDCVCC